MIRFKSEAGEFVLEVKVFSKTKTFRFFRNKKFPSGTVEISRDFISGQSTGGESRIAVFAVFCSDGRISNRQIYYLKGLKKIAGRIILEADSPVFEEELSKIKDLVCHCEFKYHREYDFGSYKRGYEYALKTGMLEDAEELVFCNDSCYGPVYPFEECFGVMAERSCDFWGMTLNKKLKKHIQSYFYVFRPKVFKSKFFAEFMHKIKKQPGIDKVIKKYETVLTEYLEKNSFSSSSFVPENIENIPADFNKTFYPLTLIKDFQVPLVKVKTFNGKYVDNLKENPAEVLKFVESVNPELAKIIKENN